MVRNIQSVTREKVPVKRIGVRTVELLLPYLVQIAQPIADLQKQDGFNQVFSLVTRQLRFQIFLKQK